MLSALSFDHYHHNTPLQAKERIIIVETFAGDRFISVTDVTQKCVSYLITLYNKNQAVSYLLLITLVHFQPHTTTLYGKEIILGKKIIHS